MNQKNLSSQDKCKRCGKCCIVWDGHSWVSCPKLIRDAKGFTTCSTYHKRLGLHRGYLYEDVMIYWTCALRQQIPYDFPGCPYNTGNPLHPAYLNTTK